MQARWCAGNSIHTASASLPDCLLEEGSNYDVGYVKNNMFNNQICWIHHQTELFWYPPITTPPYILALNNYGLRSRWECWPTFVYPRLEHVVCVIVVFPTFLAGKIPETKTCFQPTACCTISRTCNLIWRICEVIMARQNNCNQKANIWRFCGTKNEYI
jgi:hypothetical protein